MSGRRLNFPQWINNLSRSDGEVASISWKSNDKCMQVKFGTRDVDYLYICEFHKGNSKLQLSLKNVFEGKSILKALRRNKYIIMDPAGFSDVYKKSGFVLIDIGPFPITPAFCLAYFGLRSNS